MSYWLHCYPELYFQKVKKEEIPNKVKQASAHLVFITLAYVFNFTRVGLCLIVLHYISEAIFHGARLLDFTNKNENGSQGESPKNHHFLILINKLWIRNFVQNKIFNYFFFWGVKLVILLDCMPVKLFE